MTTPPSQEKVEVPGTGAGASLAAVSTGAETVLEHAAVGVIQTDLGGIIIDANRAFCDLLGYSKTELAGRPHVDFVHADFKAPAADFVRLVAGEIDHYHREKQYIRKDGTPVWTSVTVSLVVDQSSIRQKTINVVRDINEAKAAKDALAESEQRYRLLTEAAPHMTWTMLPDMTVEFVSKSWEQFTGLTLESAREQGWVHLVYSDDQRRFLSTVSGSLERGEPHEVECRLRRHDGEYRWVTAQAVPVKDEDGAVTKWIGTATDIQDRKRSEMRLAAEHAVSQALATSQTLDAAAPMILDALCRSLDIDVCELWLPEDGGQTLFCAVVQTLDRFEGAGQWTELAQTVRIKPGKLLAGIAWAKKAPVWFLDAATAPKGPRSALAVRVGIQGSLAFPLLAGDRARGVICLHTTQRLVEDRLLGDALASLGRTIGQFMIREAAERAQRFLSEASRILASSLDYNETLERVVNITVPAQADGCSLYLFERDGLLNRVAFKHGDPGMMETLREATSYFPVPATHYLHEVSVSGQPVLIPQVTEDTLSRLVRTEGHEALVKALRPRSVMAVPLVAHGVILGVLVLNTDDSGRVFDTDDLATAEELGRRCGLAVDNAHLYSVLLESETRFRETFENAAAGVAHLSLDGSFLRVNQTLCDMLGYEKDDLLCKAFQEVTHPEDLGGELAHIRRLLAGNIPSFTIEKRFIRRDGTALWVSKEGSLVRRADDSPDYMIAVVVDISRQKQLEDSLLKSNATLERRVQERTAELEAHTSSLRLLATRLTQVEQMERRRLAELIHDDLQQLLVAARMQAIASQADKDVSSSAAAGNLAVSLLDQAIEEARSLTAQLRPPALYESGLGASLGWLAGWMEKAHDFRVELEVGVEPLAEEDAVLLFDVARELLLNAVKHSGTDQASVRLSVPDREHVLLSVSDRGKGFDVAALSVPRTGSVGFGLFGISERAELAGGRFEVRSTPGEGTTVELLWPRTAATAGPPELTTGPRVTSAGTVRPSGSLEQPARPGQVTVVLVEDHAIVRQTLADALDRHPDLSVVAESSDGEQAIEAVEIYRPQVVVMDINLPKLNGIQATKIVKERFPEVSVVALTVHNDHPTRQAMLDAGASACLSKDGPVEALLETIRRQSRLTQHEA